MASDPPKLSEVHLGRKRTLWDDLADILGLVGMGAFVLAVTGAVPPLYGYGVAAVGFIAILLTDDLLMAVLLVSTLGLFVYVVSRIRDVKERVIRYAR